MMLKILCRNIPTGTVLSRQPKSPGINKTMCEWYKPPRVIPSATPTPAHANSCKAKGQYRCTHCGHTFEPGRDTHTLDR